MFPANMDKKIKRDSLHYYRFENTVQPDQYVPRQTGVEICDQLRGVSPWNLNLAGENAWKDSCM